MEQKVHLISFDVPFPADYGGVVDVYNKIKSLHAIGVKVILHCFEYGRGRAPHLHSLCEEVYYYKRRPFWESVSSLLPYIVSSRKAPSLLKRLTEDSYPILFEGLHTCYYVPHPSLSSRRKVVRMHNIEWNYYAQLAKAAPNLAKKVYFFLEGNRLKKYEHILDLVDSVCAISTIELHQLAHNRSTPILLSAFHSYKTVESEVGKGHFLLYHGNLSVPENQLAVELILEIVHPYLPRIELVIAGKRPSLKLQRQIKQLENVTLVSDPSEDQLCKLIQSAHIHLLPSLQNTGVKLKLLHALFKGRHCLVNEEMVKGSNVEEACIIENDLNKWPFIIQTLLEKPFSEEEKEKRKEILGQHYDNGKNAVRLKQLLFD